MLVMQYLFSMCSRCEALEVAKGDVLVLELQLATRLCAAFKDYVVEMGVKVVEDRRAEVEIYYYFLLAKILFFENTIYSCYLIYPLFHSHRWRV